MKPLRSLPRPIAGGLFCLLGMMGTIAQADVSLRSGNMTAGHGTGSSGAAATSQTATAATTAASQAQQTATVTANAQAALGHSLQALQALQKAQSAARVAAIAGMNNLGADPNHPGQQLPNVSDGLGAGALMPTGGLTTTPNSAIQVVQLANNNTVTLGQGGTVVLPTGTTGHDAVTVTGAGSVSGGTVTATAGSVTTSSGGTLATTTGGTVTVSGAGSTLTYSSATSISSTVAGTITLPNGGGTVALVANQTAIVPAGGTLAFSGSSAATVSIVGPGTVTLTGAGTLALANVGTAAAGGTITTRSGTTSFSSGATTSIAAGSSIDLTGSGTLDFTSSSGDVIPVVLPGTGGTVSNPAANFTTTGTLLSTTGYEVPTSWTNIGALSQTSNTASGQVTDTITQTAQQALLYWTTFNIGKNTTLDFDQSAGGANVGQWVAINEIQDPSLSPSQILGAIAAPGQVYVINQNGIIFGGSSQVNTHALVASALALNPDYITNGLLNDSQNNFEFQFSALETATSQTTVTHGRPTTTTTVAPLWTAPSGASGQEVFAVPTGDVTVQAGAQLTSPTDDNNDGGRIALIAPNVVNNGTISAPDGQVILAAGLQVAFTAHESDDPTLRGLDVYIGQVSAPAGTLPAGTFTFNGLPGEGELPSGLPGDDQLTLSGSGQVGSYTPPGGAVTPIMGGVATTIPVGSSVTLSGGNPSFSAVSAGTVTNAANVLDAQGDILNPGGDIEAPEADVIMAGQTVDQFGLINSSTSVILNGRVDLLADDDSVAETINGVTGLYAFSTGTVNFGTGSVTQILPEVSSATTIGTQLALPSLINVQGLTIEMAPDSLIYAPGATAPPSSSSPALDFSGAALTSGVTFNAGSWDPIGSVAGAQTTVFSNNDGQILLDTGSTIDVSGSEDVSASVADNIIAVQLRGPELADSTLQQNGPLRGQTVYVDIRDTGVYDGTPWVGTPIGDVSGYVNDIGRTAQELTINGGTVALKAGQSIVAQAGSDINVSGGWINYASASVQTTQLIADGQVVDIAQATPDVVYQGIYTGYNEISAKYGLSQTYANTLISGPVNEPGYIQGGGGGTITLAAPAMTLAGTFAGNTVAGIYQRTPMAQLASTYAGASFLPEAEAMLGVPTASTLNISFLRPTSLNVSDVYLPTSPDVEFQTDADLGQDTAVANQILLSQDIVNTEGFGNLNIDTSSSGKITVPSDVALATSPGGEITFKAANIDIEGDLAAPGGGSLSLTVFDISPSQSVPTFGNTPATDDTRGQIEVGPNASLTATGLIVDDRSTASNPDSLPLATAGGTISIAGLDVDLSLGSVIDVSGGVAISASGQESYGNAGAISILGGQDPRYGSIVSGGELILGSTMTGFSGSVGGGGALTLQAPLVQIGGSELLNGDSSTSPFSPGEAAISSNGTTLWIDSTASTAHSTDFFSAGGFGNFVLEGLGRIETNSSGQYLFGSDNNPLVSPAVLIASGTNLAPTVQIGVAQLTGSSVSLAPLSQAQTAELLPSQRTSVNLVLNAEGVTSAFAADGPPELGGGTFVNSNGGGGIVVRGDLVMQAGSSIETGPQSNSSHGVALLAGRGMIAILGQVIAPGGTITIEGGNTTQLSDNMLLIYGSNPDDPFPTVDLGPDSLLSTAGEAEQSFNALGFTTGSVLPGGTITISGNIVAEQGAQLNVSGSSGVLDETLGSLGLGLMQIRSSPYIATTVDSNGGSIVLDAAQLLFDDATLMGGAGGNTAQGGSFSISAGFPTTFDPNNPVPTTEDVTLIVTQQGINGGYSLPGGVATGLALLNGETLGYSTNVPGGAVDSYFVANPNLFVNSAIDAAASDNGGHAGGFASLTLGGTVDFVGPVNITTSRSLDIAQSSGNSDTGEQGGVIYTNDPVVLTSPYVALNSYATSYIPDEDSYGAATGGSGSLTINASVLADVGSISLQNTGTLTFNSGVAMVGDIRGDGTLQVNGQINLDAAQIYPPTEDAFTIEANDVAITSPGDQVLPALPLSAGGTLTIDAATIVQGGVLRAPFGLINLGTSASENVTLAPGSITSVSGVDPTTGQAITVPYGIVDDSGNWYDPQGNNITVAGNGPGGLPTKAVNVSGANIQIQAGATIDVSGGGDLYAYQFIPGTGGTLDILASSASTEASTEFAIIPGYSAAYAPDGAYGQNNNLTTNNAVDVGYFNSNLAVGEDVYLNASKGLPAGYYTLLPARYALLPGAYLISPSAGAISGASIVQPNGSSFVSGYVTSGLDPTAGSVYSTFNVESEAVVLAGAPYTGYSANTFFSQNAAANDLAVPRLPVDAGQLVLNATQSMTVAGMLLSQPGAGGLGGEVDIASSEDIDIVGPNAAAPPSGALVLETSQLTGFGAASLLIGGYRTQTSTGTQVTVTTNNLVVDDSGAETELDGTTVDGLAAPDITLVSNETLNIDAGSVIEQAGQLAGKAEALSLNGDGVLLRVSSDSSASIIRGNVNTTDDIPVLNIGSGVQIISSNGGPVGALTLDSTSALQVSSSATLAPVLSGNTLTLDSGLINIELGTPQTAPTSGLIITDPQLLSLLASTQSLAFLSYSSIDIYGSGQIGGVSTDSSGKTTYQESSLALHADDINYADTQNSAGVTINAQTVSLDNLPGGTTLPSLTGLGTSNLTINAQTITLGSNAVRLDQFSSVTLNASSALLLRGLGTQTAGSDATPTPASLSAGGDLIISTPLITGGTADQVATSSTTSGIDEAISAGGQLILQAPGTDASSPAASDGLDASLVLTGSSVAQNSGSIKLHSGTVDLQATGTGSPDDVSLLVNGTIDVTGLAQNFYSLTKYTNGGAISLSSANGNITLGAASVVDVSAASGSGTVDSQAGNAGSLVISTPHGVFTADGQPGTLEGQAGQVLQGGSVIAVGEGGSFSLDAESFTSPDLSVLESVLTTSTVDPTSGDALISGFDQSQAIHLRNGSIVVDGTVAAENVSISTDNGSITVGSSGEIDATAPQEDGIDTARAQTGLSVLLNPGATGGSISLQASGSIVLQGGSLLSVAAQNANDAGEGGSIFISAGAETVANGSVNIDTSAAVAISSGSILDLRVAQTNPVFDGSVIDGTSGTLDLRAPQILDGTGNPLGVQIESIAGTVVDASTITVEGYRVYQPAGGVIDSVETQVASDATAFATAMGTNSDDAVTTPGTAANEIFANANLIGSAPVIDIEDAADVIDPTGNLTLNQTWDLSGVRAGVNNEGQALPGVLTLRAAGNINIAFGASINDGFDGAGYLSSLLSPGSLSWSYRLVAGADLGAANFGQVQALPALQSSGLGGSLEIGVQSTSTPTELSLTSLDDPSEFFQAIRTGTGSITIKAGDDVLLLNNLATIYTAGTQVDPTLGGTFTAPTGTGLDGQTLPATYSDDGGNVAISAQGDIAHYAYSGDGSTLVADSSDELPTSWLDREGAVSGGQVTTPTTWWVDFTNFFEGVGALGGGNVSLAAGGSVINVDAVAPTNARLVDGTLTELGGGDVTVQAGNDIDGGVYYVERGQGTISAGNNIQTNATRTALALGQPATSLSRLPTSYFLGAGTLSITAGGNLLMGPVANPFLLPQSANNIESTTNLTAELSYFSTYASTDAVNVSALSGTVTLQDYADGGEGSLAAWYANVMDEPLSGAQLGSEIAAAEPWLKLAVGATFPQNVVTEFEGASTLPTGSPDNSFGGVTSLLPATLRVTSYSGDLDIIGGVTLSPSATGTIDLAAAGSVNAFQVNSSVIAGIALSYSGSGLIDLSDADPALLPSASSPLSSATQLTNLNSLFTVTGATEGLTLQTLELLHDDENGEPLYYADPTPAYVYALTGSISGLNFFSAKQAQIIAGEDITDIGLYLQNDASTDISLVEAGRDIVAYDAISPLRIAAGTNLLGYRLLDPLGAGAGAPNSGDIQISGPGTLEVLAGRNLTLGNDDGQNPNDTVSGDGLFAGLTSVGGEVNPALAASGGADLVAAAGLTQGVQTSAGLEGNGSLNFSAFITEFLNPSSVYASRYLPELGAAMGLGNQGNAQVWASFENLSSAQQDVLALDIFYLVLRDAGRDHNDATAVDFGNYAAGDQAIAALFPAGDSLNGNIDITSREIKTARGGNIELLAPGGGITVGVDSPGQAVDQGILTVDGGNISIFANQSVSVGTSRIFTLHGGNEIIWSSTGNIAAGASSKTVVSAPPTVVVVDPTSGDVEPDLAGFVTGGGIGVLASVVGAPPGDVDLIAPLGIVDAGDAGIRATGNLNIAAVQVLNASNISVGGKSSGVPTATSVNLGAISAASSVAGSTQQAAANTTPNRPSNGGEAPQQPSIISVDVLGYGGGEDG
jgi:filamentous hemagglutinin